MEKHFGLLRSLPRCVWAAAVWSGRRGSGDVMAIRTIKPQLRSLPPLVARPARDSAEASRDRDAALEYRAWYKTARWRDQRLAVIWRDRCTCAKCGRRAKAAADLADAARMTGATLADRRLRDEFSKALTRDAIVWVADHITPHRGDAAMFWDVGNAQCMCKRCHDSYKAKLEIQQGLR